MTIEYHEKEFAARQNRASKSEPYMRISPSQVHRDVTVSGMGNRWRANHFRRWRHERVPGANYIVSLLRPCLSFTLPT